VKARASEMLNLGIWDCQPKSFHWDGDTFGSITGYHGVTFKGRLVRDEQNGPKQLDMIVAYQHGSTPWDVEYDFSRSASLPEYIPTKISAWARTQPRAFEFEIRVISLKTTERELPAEMFMPGPFADKNFYTIFHSSRGKLLNNQFDPTFRPLNASSNRPSGLFLFVIANALLISFAFSIWWRRNIKNKKSINHNQRVI
jgi:hypothetical protein